MDSTERSFELNRAPLGALAAFSLGMAALGAWMSRVHLDTGDLTTLHVLGVLLALLFSLLALLSLGRLLSRRPGLVLSQQGIFDGASVFSAGMVPWSDVTGLRAVQVGMNTYLVVEVSDPERYILRGSPLTRWLRRGNARLLGSPVFIGSRAVKADFDELLASCAAYFEKYGRPGGSGQQEAPLAHSSASDQLRAIYVRVATVLAIAVVFTFFAAFAPDLVFQLGGRVVPEAATVLIAGALLWLLFGVIGLVRSPRRFTGGQPQGQGDSAETRGRLNTNVGARELLTIVLPFAVFALAAVGLSAMTSPGINLMTTDAHGNLYLQTGDDLLVADSAGAVLAEVDLASLGIPLRDVTELRASDPGHVFLADPDAAAVYEVDTRSKRARTLDASAAEPYDSIMALALRDDVSLVVGRTSVVECGAGSSTVLYDDADLRFPSGLEVDHAGRLLVSDSDNSKVVVLEGNTPVRTISMGTGFGAERYPTGLRSAADGTIYTVARKRDPGVPPMYWRGRLGAAGPSDSSFKRIELTWKNRSLDVLDFSVLPDGRLLFVPLGFDSVLVAGSTGQAEEWAPGELRLRLQRMTTGAMLIRWGPVLLLVTGIALAMTGFAAAYARGAVAPQQRR